MPSSSLSVSFRFYAQLNDFLPVNRRGRRFTHLLGALGSVKDTARPTPHPNDDTPLWWPRCVPRTLSRS